MNTESNITTPTQFVRVKNATYAYRRFGKGSGVPLLFLQHFMGTLDNWDPAVTDPLAASREVLLLKTPALDDQPVMSRTRLPGWRGMHWVF